MNAQELNSGLEYFGRLLQSHDNSTEGVYVCPVTGGILPDMRAVRHFAAPFIVAARNAVLARPGDFVDHSMPRTPVITRLLNFIAHTRMDQNQWRYGNVVLETMQQARSQGTWSENPLPAYHDWQLAVLNGMQRRPAADAVSAGNALDPFDIGTPAAQADFTYVRGTYAQDGVINVGVPDMETRLNTAYNMARLENLQEPRPAGYDPLPESPILASVNDPLLPESSSPESELLPEPPPVRAPGPDPFESSSWDPLFNQDDADDEDELETAAGAPVSNPTFNPLLNPAASPFSFFNPAHIVDMWTPPNSRPYRNPNPQNQPLENQPSGSTVPMPPPLLALPEQAPTQGPTPQPSASRPFQGFLPTFRPASPPPAQPPLLEVAEAFGDLAPIERRVIRWAHGEQLRLTNVDLVGPYQASLALPRIPVVHPYHPVDHGRPDPIREDHLPHGHLRMSVALRLDASQASLPLGVRERLEQAGVPLENLDVLLSIQDNPWNENTPLLLRTHPYLHPLATENAQDNFVDDVQVAMADVNGRFSEWSVFRVHTHAGSFSPDNMQILGETHFEQTRLFYSLCTNPRTGRAALTLHALMEDLDSALLTEALADPEVNNVPRLVGAIEAINEATAAWPVNELRFLTGLGLRPNNVQHHQLAVSQYHLTPAPRISQPFVTFGNQVMPSNGDRLADQFSGQHSAGGTDSRLEYQVNRAGLEFVERVLGTDFVPVNRQGALVALRGRTATRFNAMVEDLCEQLRANLRALDLDPAFYNSNEHPAVYFNSNAVALRAIIHNAALRGEGRSPEGYYHRGIILREIIAVWQSIKHLPTAERDDHLENLVIQLIEIQRAYNIARFYQHFFGADYRSPTEWYREARTVSYTALVEAWNRVEANLHIIRSAYINRPSEPLLLDEAPVGPLTEQAHLRQERLRQAHAAAERRFEQFDRVQAFILGLLPPEAPESRIPITLEMAGFDENEQPNGDSILELFLRIVETMNRVNHPTASLHRDNFDLDAGSCAAGSETRMIDVAQTLPNANVVHVSPAEAAKIISEVVYVRLLSTVRSVINAAPEDEREALQAAYDATVHTREQLVLLSGLFIPVEAALHRILREVAAHDLQMSAALAVRNPLTHSMTMDDTIHSILENENICSPRGLNAELIIRAPTPNRARVITDLDDDEIPPTPPQRLRAPSTAWRTRTPSHHLSRHPSPASSRAVVMTPPPPLEPAPQTPEQTAAQTTVQIAEQTPNPAASDEQPRSSASTETEDNDEMEVDVVVHAPEERAQGAPRSDGSGVRRRRGGS